MGLLYWKWTVYPLSLQGSPTVCEYIYIYSHAYILHTMTKWDLNQVCKAGLTFKMQRL